MARGRVKHPVSHAAPPCRPTWGAANPGLIALSTLPAQLPLLKKRWVYILCGAAFQYMHGLGTQLAHRMHRPLPQPLHDIGFDALPVSRNLETPGRFCPELRVAFKL